MKAIFSNGLKKLLCTGPLVVTMTTTLTGCANEDYSYDEYSYEEEYQSEDEIIVSESFTQNNNLYEQNNTNSKPLTNSNVNDSNNYRLYVSNLNMNTVITDEMIYYMRESRSNDNADRRLQSGSFIPIDINITEEDYNEFIKIVDTIDVVYEYEKYYDIEESLNRTGAKVVTNHTHMICDINQIPTEEMLYNVVISNNKQYLKEYPELYKLSNNQIKEAVSIVIDAVKDNYPYLTEESKKRVYCFLGNLKIVGIDSMDRQVNPSGNIINAMMCSDGAMFIDENQIDLLHDQEAFEKTIRHEAEHIFQKSCIDNETEEFTQVGISQTWENEQMNPETWKFAFEGTAELNTMREYNETTPLTYTNMVRYNQALDFVISINPNYGHNTMEVLNMNQDVEGVYKAFGAETLEEKKEIIAMLYAIDHLQIYRDDFVENYEKESGLTYNDDEAVSSTKTSIMLTLTKCFYRNLAERIKNGDATLQDILYLINVFESDVNSHMTFDKYNNTMTEEDAKIFAQNYLIIQNEFFETISNGSSISTEELNRHYKEYSLVLNTNNTYIRNAELKWMTEEEKKLASTLLTQNIEYVTLNVNEIFNEEGERKAR